MKPRDKTNHFEPKVRHRRKQFAAALVRTQPLLRILALDRADLARLLLHDLVDIILDKQRLIQDFFHVCAASCFARACGGAVLVCPGSLCARLSSCCRRCVTCCCRTCCCVCWCCHGCCCAALCASCQLLLTSCSPIFLDLFWEAFPLLEYFFFRASADVLGLPAGAPLGTKARSEQVDHTRKIKAPPICGYCCCCCCCCCS